MEESITPPFSEKNETYTVKKKINHKHLIKQYIHQKVIKLTQFNHYIKQGLLKIIDKENTVDKSRSIPRSNYYNESTRIEKPSEIHIHKDNISVSGSSGQGKS